MGRVGRRGREFWGGLTRHMAPGDGVIHCPRPRARPQSHGARLQEDWEARSRRPLWWALGSHGECAGCRAVQGGLCGRQVRFCFCATSATCDRNLITRPKKAEVVKHSASVSNLDCQEHSIGGLAGTGRTPGGGRFRLHQPHLTSESGSSRAVRFHVRHHFPPEAGPSLACGLSGPCTPYLAVLQDAALNSEPAAPGTWPARHP